MADIGWPLSITLLMATSVAIVGYNISSFPACGTLFLAGTFFWEAVFVGYVHQFVGACEVTSRVSAERRRLVTTSPSSPYHGVLSC